jgi:uncharacterized protein (TIGR02145 family)
MKTFLPFLLIVFLLLPLDVFTQTIEVFNDSRDNISYKTTTIGEQVWMAENLNAAFYSNGDSIPEARNKNEWNAYRKALKGCFCYYQFDPTTAKLYGKFYNGFAVHDLRGIAPKGWHVPYQEEVYKLFNFLGLPDIANIKLKSNNWPADPNIKKKNRSLINESGFSGEPAGYCLYGFPRNFQEKGMWWTASVFNKKQLFYFSISSGADATTNGGGITFDAGLTVRCVKD